jgi:Fe-S oxidoreductase
MATSFRGEGSRREPPTTGKQLVNFITCGWDNYTGVTGEKSQKVLAKLDINFTLITNTYAGSP